MARDATRCDGAGHGLHALQTRVKTTSPDAYVAKTVEDSRAFAQGKKLVERHPFLTRLLGPSIVRKLFGR